jgi:DNA polymerase III alpha subunit
MDTGVSQIITYQAYGVSSALHDAARAHGLPRSAVQQILDTAGPGAKPQTMAELINDNEELCNLQESTPQVAELISSAIWLENFTVTSDNIHAAGVVIWPAPAETSDAMKAAEIVRAAMQVARMPAAVSESDSVLAVEMQPQRRAPGKRTP